MLAALAVAEWAPVAIAVAVLVLLVLFLPWWGWGVSGGATAVVLVWGYLLRRRDGGVSD